MALLLITRDPNGHAPVTAASSTPHANDICAWPVLSNLGLRSAILSVTAGQSTREKGDNSGSLLLNDGHFCLTRDVRRVSGTRLSAGQFRRVSRERERESSRPPGLDPVAPVMTDTQFWRSENYATKLSLQGRSARAPQHIGKPAAAGTKRHTTFLLVAWPNKTCASRCLS